MDDLRTLALEAALRLDQVRRGHRPDAPPIAELGIRYESREHRAARRHAGAHRRALAAIGLEPRDDSEADAALAALGRDLAGAAEGCDLPSVVRCRDFCLALHEALSGRPDGP